MGRRRRSEMREGAKEWTISAEHGNSSTARQRRRKGREPWKRPGAASHPSCQMALKESRGRAFSSEGRMWNADHRSEESTIQSACLPCAPLGWESICQVKTAANIFRGAWNTDKENQVWRMRADLDHSNSAALPRLCWDSAESARDTMSLPQLSSRSSFSSLTIKGENKLNRPNILEEIPPDYSFAQYSGLLCRSLHNSHFAVVVCKNQYKLHFLYVSRYRLNVFSCHWWGTAGAAMLHCCTCLLLLTGILHIQLRVLWPQPNNYSCCSIIVVALQQDCFDTRRLCA